jgi:hypothetical protein
MLRQLLVPVAVQRASMLPKPSRPASNASAIRVILRPALTACSSPEMGSCAHWSRISINRRPTRVGTLFAIPPAC